MSIHRLEFPTAVDHAGNEGSNEDGFVMKRCAVILTLIALAATRAQATGEIDTGPLLETLRTVKAKGEGNRAAREAWKQLAAAEATQLTEILAGMKDAGRLGENWIRAVVETIVQRELQRGTELPLDDLESFLVDIQQPARARRLAYEILALLDDNAEARLISGLINDPSLELRRDAITLALHDAEQQEKAGKRELAIETYWRAFHASRHLDQIKTTSQKLRALKQSVNLPIHMGFLTRWKVIGSFDNTDENGFDRAYPPEKKVDFTASHEGKLEQVRWIDHITTDDYGIVDLNVIFERPKTGDSYGLTDKHKGAIAYACAEYLSDQIRDVDLRLGSINANKIWLNGELLTANEVYHAGMEVDQYVVKGRMMPGKNTIMLKLAQNERSEKWAQRWQFQLRVCDELGTAVLSEADRKP